MRDYNQKQFLHKHEQDEHIRLAEEKIPRLGEIRRQIAALGLKKARLVLGAGQGEDFDLEAAIGALAQERKALLLENGFPADYLELHYDCPICKDTGYVEGEIFSIPSPISGISWKRKILSIFLFSITPLSSQIPKAA